MHAESPSLIFKYLFGRGTPTPANPQFCSVITTGEFFRSLQTDHRRGFLHQHLRSLKAESASNCNSPLVYRLAGSCHIASLLSRQKVIIATKIRLLPRQKHTKNCRFKKHVFLRSGSRSYKNYILSQQKIWCLSRLYMLLPGSCRH